MSKISNSSNSFSKNYSVFYDVLTTRWQYRVLILFLSFLAAIFGLMSPFLQKEFIDTLSGHPPLPLWDSFSSLSFMTSSPTALILTAFLFFLTALLLSQFCNYLGLQEALFMQKKLSEKLYKKTLELRLDALAHRPVGEIVSIYATDVPGSTILLEQTLPSGAATFFPLILAPFAISWMFPVPLWPTLLIMFVVATLNTSLAFRQSKFFYSFKQLAAERTGLVSEWIQNIRTLRILNWVQGFEKNIFRVRIVETKNRVGMVTNGQLMNSISSSVTFFLNISALMGFVYFSTHQLTGGELMALLWILGIFLTRPFRQMPWFFTMGFDSWTSLKRLQKFLSIENRPSLTPQNNSLKTSDVHNALEVEGLYLTLNGQEILKNIEIKIKDKSFVAIIGEVGSGKSLLLLSLMQETGAQFKTLNILGQDKTHSSAEDIKKHFSLVPQESFIMSSTLRDNVLFNYDCPTDQDSEISRSLLLSQFDITEERSNQGLDTEIGERGVNLSGGQRQRISLARANLKPCDILLLDDCLSAVDVETEKKLLDSLFFGEWKSKTRILATHRLSVLEKVDEIIFLHEGRIKNRGNYNDLLLTDSDFREFTVSLLKKEKEAQYV